MSESVLETIIVGAGPSGTLAARKLQERHPSMQILILEAGDRLGGKAHSGLHLLPVSEVPLDRLKTGTELKEARVRWEREWLPASEVKWEDNDWIGQLPQWEMYLQGNKIMYLGMEEAEVDVAVKSLCPISRLSRLEDSTSHWKLESSKQSFLAKKVIWAAGLTAFQNAVGKLEAQEYLVANPKFQMSAQDFRGGLGLDMLFDVEPQLLAEIPVEHVLAIPIKHGGSRYLCFAALARSPENKFLLKTLTHVHRELLLDPKEVTSLQKSLRRFIIQNLFQENTVIDAQERWVLSHRIGGHTLGSPWLLGAGIKDSLEFVGEEALSAQYRGNQDTLGALDSVNALQDLSF